MYKKGTKSGEYDEADVPDEYKDVFERYSQDLIETIATTARTDKIGDGKIFILALENAVRVRTGEAGDEAL